MQHVVGVLGMVVGPNAFRNGIRGVSSVEGSVGNVVSVLVVTDADLQTTCECPGIFAIWERVLSGHVDQLPPL